MKRTLHKALSILLTAAMVLNMGLTPVFAAGIPIGASGLTDCHTAHNSECGYSETTTVTPCAHTCEVCEVLDSGKPAEKVCTCPPVDSGEPVHGGDCPLYTAPERSEAVKTLIAMVDALPNAADITEENKEATKRAYEAAALAYEALSDEDKAAFEQTLQYTKLMALREALFGTALTPEELDLLQRGEQNQAALSLDEQLAYLLLVARLRAQSGMMPMGLGDADMPFQIGTAAQLADLAAKVNAGNADFNAKSYILANDIHLSAYQSGTGWTTIGTSGKPFKGTFDGSGKVITGLVINNAAATYRGLFGVIGSDGRVKNLGVVDCDIKGGGSVGGVAGGSDGKIENCYTTGSVSGNDLVGGVAGQNSGKIENCYTTGSVSGNDFVGGVAGGSIGKIENCYTTGSISGNNFVGGVAGYNGDIIENCYSTGSVSGDDAVGGVVGQNGGSIENCAALNPSISGTANVGRVAGWNTNTLTGNYAWSGMTGGGSDKTADGTDGTDLTCTGGTLNKQLSELFSDNGAWTFADNKLPILAGVGGNQSSDLPVWMTTAQSADTLFISTAAQLKQLATEVNGGDNKDGKTYTLLNDIDLSAYQSGTDWTPIGTSGKSFKGTFDGGGKVITGLVINNATATSRGLFGQIETGGTVKNLGVVDCSIIGGGSVGGVVGSNSGKIENCYTTGSVSGNIFVGGVAGENRGTIENCYSTGSVSGNSYVGGVAGSNDSTIKNCYSTGSISGSGTVGGVVGLNGGSIENCAALNPSISGTADVGRVVGQHGGITLTGNYAWSGMTGGGSDKTANGKDGADLTCTGGTLNKQFSAIFSGNAAWTFANNKLPILAGVGGDQSSDLPVWMTTAQSADTFFISTAEQLAKLTTEVNGGDGKDGKTYILAKNIDLSAYQSGTGWTTIGNYDNRFKGTFDGGGKIITGLVINNAAATYRGLFGVIGSDGRVKNLGVVDCSIIGGSVGGVAGYNNGTIENCYTTGSISGNSTVGGVAGQNDGKIENCYSTGSVSGGGSIVGGVAGENNGKIENCYTIGSVSGSGNGLVGGVAGRNDGTIENCYSTGSVSGNSYVGGVAGSNNSTIKNCYSTGSISGSGSVGGVVGENYDTIENCAALNPSISSTANVGRVVGWNGGFTTTAATSTNNYAWSGMSVKQGGADKLLDKGADKVDGADVFAVGGILKKSDNTAFRWAADLSFSTSVWDIPTGAYKLPRLLGSSSPYPEMPGGLVEQVTITQGKTEFVYTPDGVDISAAFNVFPPDAADVTYTTSTASVAISDSMLTFATTPTSNTTVSVTAAVAAGAFNSAASLTVFITIKPYATTTTLVADKAAIPYRGSVALTATVAKASSGDPGEPSGSVQFKNGGTNLGTPVAVVGGKARYTLTDLPVGAHNITAVFTSDSSSLFGGSTSSDVTVTVSSGGGGSTGGSGNGGSGSTPPATDKPSGNVDSKGAVTAADVAQQTAQAIADSLKAGKGNHAEILVQNAASISPQALKEMAAAAAKAGGTVQLQVDSTVNGAIMARLYINPALAANLKNDILLGVKLDEHSTKYTKDKFSCFDNKLAVVSFTQQGQFGMRIEIAAKLDLTGLNTKTLHFYSYDKATNLYYPIPYPEYWIDKNGFLHFKTTRGGDIVITEKPLVLKK